MPQAKKRKSPYDRFTDASPTAISAGFAAAMSIGPQPKGINGSKMEATSSAGPSAPAPSFSDMGVDAFGQGSDWLQSLQNASGVASGNGFGEDDEGGEDDDPDTPTGGAGAGASASKSTTASGATTKRKRGGQAGTAKRGGKRAESQAAPGGGADDEDEAAAAQHRKEQNRLAQREFRQRRQQYVRALEGRVELLSSDHDDQVDRLRHALRGLLAENNTLRTMVGSLGRFIGEGLLGGPLQHNGISRQQLEEMINGRSEKTMTDAWQNWPGAKECEALRQIRMEANIPADGLPEMRNSSPGPSRGGATTSAATAAATATAPTGTSSSGRKTRKSGGGGGNGTASAGPATSADDSNNASTSHDTTTSTSFLAPSTSASSSSLPTYNHPSNVMPAATFTNSVQLNGAGSPFPFGGTDAPDAALLASLFGPGSFTPGGSISTFTGTTPTNTTVGTGQTGLTPLTTRPASSVGGIGGASAPTGVGAPSSSTSSPTAATTPRTALQNSAHSFLQSLRSLDEGDRTSLSRVQTIADQLNSLRASQGRRDLISLFGDCASGATVSDSTRPFTPRADDGGTPQNDEEMSRMTSAFIQTAYHMSNYRRNASYRLPSILRPTDLQLTRPHDPIIDGVPLPGLRDALIEQHAQGRVDLDDVLFYLLCATKVAEGDVLSQETWMLDHSFVLRFPSLATDDVLAATNRWRRTTHDLEPLAREDVLALSGPQQQQKTSAAGNKGGAGAGEAAGGAK